jgi:hypothetical protein
MSDVIEIEGVPCVSTGTINARLHFLTVKALDLELLGFEPAGTIKAGKYWAVSDLPAIGEKLIEQIRGSLQ